MKINNKKHSIITQDGCIVNGNFSTVKANKCIINGNFIDLYGKHHIINGNFTNVYGSCIKDNGNFTNYHNKPIGKNKNKMKKKSGQMFNNHGNVIGTMTVNDGSGIQTIDDTIQINRIGRVNIFTRNGGIGVHAEEVSMVNGTIQIQCDDGIAKLKRANDGSVKVTFPDDSSHEITNLLVKSPWKVNGIEFEVTKTHIIIKGKGKGLVKYSRNPELKNMNSNCCNIVQGSTNIRSFSGGNIQIGNGMTMVTNVPKKKPVTVQNFSGSTISNSSFINIPDSSDDSDSDSSNGFNFGDVGSNLKNHNPESHSFNFINSNNSGNNSGNNNSDPEEQHSFNFINSNNSGNNRNNKDMLNNGLTEEDALKKAMELSMESKLKNEEKKAPEDIKEEDACVVCMDAYKSSVFGCGHVQTCYSCSIKLWETTKKCPSCNHVMEQKPLKLKSKKLYK